jgi:hypothetical protein
MPTMPTTFLSLVPETSSSYPTQRASTSAADASATTAGATTTTASTTTTDAAKETSSAVDLTAPAAAGDAATAKARRSSSISSTGSGGLKFLRLGPVHFGGDPRQADFVLLAEE